MSVEDKKIRLYILKNFHDALIDKVEIERLTSMNSFDKEKKPEITIFVRCVNVSYINDEQKKNETILFVNKLIGKEYKVNIIAIEFLNQY
jgi:hypothetical protein